MSRVSIILPVYNAERYLRECLNSVISQSLTDIEIICINDGSSDNSLGILEEYAAKDNRIKILNQENKGSAAARNLGIKSASGEYIGFIDSDDFVSKQYFENLYKTAIKNKADIAATSNCIIYNGINNSKKYTGLEKKKIIETIDDKSKIILATGISWNKIYNRKFLINNQISCLEIKNAAEDNYFTACTAIKANKIAVTNKATYYYRTNEASQTQTLKDKSSFSMIDVYTAINKFISEQDFSQDKKENWFKIVQERALTDYDYFVNTMKEDCKKEFTTLFKNAFLKNIKPVIISLTSYPARINTVHKTIKTLLNQDIKADKVVLWLSKEEFPNGENDLPQDLLDLIPEGLEIGWYKNIRSYKKLIPTLKKYPDNIIVTTDDDILYPTDWLKKLLFEYIKNPEFIHTHRAHLILFKSNKKIKPYHKWYWDITNIKPSYNNFLTGVGGVLYPPNVLYKDVLDEEKFTKLAPLADDIWFWAMAVLNNTKINVIPNNMSDLNYIEGTQEYCLYSTNITQNDRQLKNIFAEYPELLTKLEKIKNYDGLTLPQRIFSLKNNKNKTHKILTILGLKLKINTFILPSILYKIKFPFLKVRKNSILLIEPNEIDHAEVIPGYAKYLLDLGYNVDVLLTINNYKLKCLSRFKNQNLRIFPIHKNLIETFLSSSILEQYNILFFTSDILYRKIGFFSTKGINPQHSSIKYPNIFDHFPFLDKYREKMFVVNHHQELLDNNLLKNKRIITLVKFNNSEKNITAVNPNYFGKVKYTSKNNKVTKFISIGALENKRRNSNLLLKTVRELRKQNITNFEIIAIGRYNKKDFTKQDFKTIKFLGRVSADVLYKKLEEADFFLPMLDPENSEHNRYITKGTSGSFQLIYGFNKPCLIAEKFIVPHHFNSNNSIIYKTNSEFCEAMKRAINISSKDYDNLRQNLAKTTKTIRKESFENLKKIITGENNGQN